jgi:transcriptional regulator with XRE-family HTH domain
MDTDKRPFGVVVRDLLIDRGFTTGMGNPNWSGFALDAGIGYETLRKAVSGERAPGAKLMEDVAGALKVSPELFSEYALLQAQRMFDPREVGTEQALANLEAWSAVQPKRAKRGSLKPRPASG